MLEDLLNKKTTWIGRFFGRAPTVSTKDKEGITPLYEACRSGRLEILRFLLKRGVSINNENANELLYAALNDKQLDIADELLLIFRNEKILFNRNKLLLRLCDYFKYNEEAVRWLLENRANPNCCDDFGDTALHKLFKYKNLNLGIQYSFYFYSNSTSLIETVLSLLQAGAKATAKNNDGITPIDMLKKSEPSMTRVIAGLASLSPEKNFDGLFTASNNIYAQLQNILQSYIDAPFPEIFVSKAINTQTVKKLPFTMIPIVIKKTFDHFNSKFHSKNPADLIHQILEAFSFSCSKCRQLNPESIHLAVAAMFLNEASPKAGITFYGLKEASVFAGVCPHCGSQTAEVSFDPKKIKLPI